MILNNSFYVEAFVGPNDGVGEERFGFTVCTPRWLAAQVTTHGARFGHSYILLDFYMANRRRISGALRSVGMGRRGLLADCEQRPVTEVKIRPLWRRRGREAQSGRGEGQGLTEEAAMRLP